MIDDRDRALVESSLALDQDQLKAILKVSDDRKIEKSVREERETVNRPELQDTKSFVVKTGDLWQVGKHRIYCGDFTDPNTKHLLFKDADASLCGLVFVDPPQNVGMEYTQYKDSLSPEAYITFCNALINTALDYAPLSLFHVTKYALATWLNAMPSDIKFDMGVWLSDIALSTSEFAGEGLWSTFFVAGNGDIRSMRLNDLFAFNYSDAFIDVKNQGRYPCPLPRLLVADIFTHFSKKGEVIVDACCGSGTGIVAGHTLKRTVYAVEIDPTYCELAIQRIYELTRKEPVKLIGE